MLSSIVGVEVEGELGIGLNVGTLGLVGSKAKPLGSVVVTLTSPEGIEVEGILGQYFGPKLTK
jgi:hypothetical protein